MNTAEPSSEFKSRPWMDDATAPESRPIHPDRNWLVASHAAPLLLWILYPYGSAIIIPLLIWQLKAIPEKKEDLAASAVEALNLQINFTILCVALSVTVIGLVAVPFVMLAGLVLSIVASYKTYRGEQYKYPWIKRVIRSSPAQEVNA